MMRSLWSGVTGLQAHQIGMDVEGNNIANVNTKGYKFTMVSFADQISQTAQTASPPSGGGGGTNPKQIGLGTTAEAASKVFTQGHFEDTSVNTHLAIQNDGFFIISSDGGKSLKYTRNGQFNFDEQGNFVTTGGYIVQGWVRNPVTGLIDKTKPVSNITIPKGLNTEAKASTYVKVIANLNSGTTVGKDIAFISPLDKNRGGLDKNKPANGIDTVTAPALPDEEHDENSNSDLMFDKDQNVIEAGLDAKVLFDSTGQSLNIRKGQGVWMSYKDAISEHTITATGPIASGSLTLNGQTINIQTTVPSGTPNPAAYNAEKIADIINDYSAKTGVVATTNGAKLVLKNNNRVGTTETTKNITLTNVTGTLAGMSNDTVITAYKYQYSSTSNADTHTLAAPLGDTTARFFKTTEDLRALMQVDVNKQLLYLEPLVLKWK